MKKIFVFVFVAAFSTFASAQAERDKGVELFRSGEYSKAIEVLEGLRASGEADYTVATYLGASYVKVGKNDLASEVFNKANSYGPAGKSLEYEKKIVVKKRPMAKFESAVKIAEGSGLVRVAVEFRQNGTIGFVFPFSTTSEKLLQGAIDAAAKIRFEPAIKDSKPVTVVLIVEYAFQIR